MAAGLLADGQPDEQGDHGHDHRLCHVDEEAAAVLGRRHDVQEDEPAEQHQVADHSYDLPAGVASKTSRMISSTGTSSTLRSSSFPTRIKDPAISATSWRGTSRVTVKGSLERRGGVSPTAASRSRLATGAAKTAVSSFLGAARSTRAARAPSK